MKLEAKQRLLATQQDKRWVEETLESLGLDQKHSKAIAGRGVFDQNGFQSPLGDRATFSMVEAVLRKELGRPEQFNYPGTSQLIWHHRDIGQIHLTILNNQLFTLMFLTDL